MAREFAEDPYIFRELKATEINYRSTPVYPVEITIPVENGFTKVRSLLYCDKYTPAVVSIIIPLTKMLLYHENDEYYVEAFNQFCEYNQESLGLVGEENFESTAIQKLGVNEKRKIAHLNVTSSWGKHPKEYALSENSATSSLQISGVVISCGELLGFTPIIYAPTSRCEMFINEISKSLGWTFNV